MKALLSALVVGFVLMFFVAAPVAAEAAKSIQLPAPQMTGGKPLMEALKARCTQREFSSDSLPPQELSNLLWAACGINRPEKGLRTAPTAMNKQEIDVYVALARGLYLYDAKANALNLVVAQDLREATGQTAVREDRAGEPRLRRRLREDRGPGRKSRRISTRRPTPATSARTCTSTARRRVSRRSCAAWSTAMRSRRP